MKAVVIHEAGGPEKLILQDCRHHSPGRAGRW